MHYEDLVRAGSLKEDTQQRDALHKLGQLQAVLQGYSNSVYLIPPKPKLKGEEGEPKQTKGKDPKLSRSQSEGDAEAEEVGDMNRVEDRGGGG